MYYTLMMVEMIEVYDKNNAVVNTPYVASTCGEVNLMGRIETRKPLLLSTSCFYSDCIRVHGERETSSDCEP